MRIAVLVSGRGSNLQALLDAIDNQALDAEIAGVFSDRPDAAALQRVAPSLRWSEAAKSFPDRPSFDHALAEAVAACRPDWVVCAGYMRILGDGFNERFRGRILNIHPSLLPKYRGLHTHQRALDAGDTVHGASVHFVTAELDGGPVIAQAEIPVVAGDTADRLAERLLEHEHRLLAASVALIAAGRIALTEAGVLHDGHPLRVPLRLASDGTLARHA